MADVSHLERMGRELKCPICLSLLNSSVSLTCNHVFCQSCIEKSMKAASNCPVCKVPYRRREIRPAPHMDNLVSVYKSMEVASGVSIFVTQAAVPTKPSGEDICEAPENDQNHVGTVGSLNQNQRQGKRSKSVSMTTQSSSGTNLVKPSFPTKKRVQVPQYPTPEAQMEPDIPDNRIGEIGRHEPQNRPVLQKDRSFICEKGEPVLSPFFWLREHEDLEKSSQQTDDNQDMYTPPEVPCFSDMKDSDDEVPYNRSPERGACILSNNADFIDSEMFDWTQRPCSPELCSSSLAMQNEDPPEQNAAHEKAGTTLTGISTGPMISPNAESLGKKRVMGKTSDDKGGMGTSNQKASNATVPRKTKRVRKSICEVTAVHTESDKLTYEDMQEGNKESPLSLKGKPRKSKRVFAKASCQEKTPTQSDGAEPLANRNEAASVSASENLQKNSEESCKLRKSGRSRKNMKNALAQSQKFGSEVKSGNSDTGKGYINTEQDTEVLVCQPHAKLLPLGNDKEVIDTGITRTDITKSKKMPNSKKKVKFSGEGMPKVNCDGMSLHVSDEDAVRGQVFQGPTDQLAKRVSAKTDKSISSVTMNGGVLVKCNTSPRAIRCAFCQSSEESEASGIMVHYLDGKPVTVNHNERTNVLHVHKNCAEWAPNVYFEDDNAINLEAELSRSKRIRCSCCGIKGAVLGCYETCCRRSFHVPCARLMPECRWDFENFVVLCPIHASSQLPNEIPQSQSRQKRKSAAERKSCSHQLKATEECNQGSTLQWKSQKKLKNLVLCCSALSNTEKGIVAEFENLSGVTILKNWDSTITHVIASPDENEACRRTLKFLMGVLEGKWILSVQWIKACMQSGELVDEQPFEISIDIHGIRDGPRLGRLRLLDKRPKLFDGYNFFFMGDFEPSYKGYLHKLVIAAGGKVLNRKPIAGDHATDIRSPARTVIVYSLELPDQCKPSNGSSILNNRRAHAEALASSTGSIAASNSWILNSIAGYRLQEVGE